MESQSVGKLAASDAAIRVPEAIAEALVGKRFALIGFNPAEAGRAVAALDAARAFSRVVAAAEATGASRALAPFDVAIVALPDSGDDQPSPSGPLLEAQKPTLLVGSRQCLLDQGGALGALARDFLIAPWTDEDLLLRSFHLLASAPASSPSGARRPRDGKPIVVVADDDDTTSTLIATILANSGMECHVARDGGQALEIVKRLGPDAAVLDVNMPRLDGFAVLAALRNEAGTRHIPVLILSARQQEADVVRGFALGADDYVVKPFNPLELAARVKRLVRGG